MLRVTTIVAALVSVVFAGCLQADPSASLEVPDTGLLLDWVGRELQGDENTMMTNPPPFMDRPPRPACNETNCERTTFEVPPGRPDVIVAIEWEAQDESYSFDTMPGGYLGSANAAMDLAIYKDGALVYDAPESFHYASVGILQDAEPGQYTAETVARWGRSTYLGSVALIWDDPAPIPEGEPLLPDLVMLPPDHLTFTVPIGLEADALLGAATPGCGPDEVAEDQELRCLRFAGILGNQGIGDFEANLQYDQAIAATTGDGRWQQRIYLKGGGEEVHPIGRAEYHAIHGHYHILDFVETILYEFDEESGERGQDTGFGRKTGFCIIDGGLIDPLNPRAEAKYQGGGCCYLAGLCTLDMISHPYFSMGMSPGWYDIYPWWRADQYVEVSGLADGTYELVSRINPDGLLTEATIANNEAGTIFRLAGDQVEVLEQWSQADVGPHPDANWGYES